MSKLNKREIEVIKYTAKGYTSKQIAKLIGLQYRTVQAYISNIKKKINAKNVAHAVYIVRNSITEET